MAPPGSTSRAYRRHLDSQRQGAATKLQSLFRGRSRRRFVLSHKGELQAHAAAMALVQQERRRAEAEENARLEALAEAAAAAMLPPPLSPRAAARRRRLAENGVNLSLVPGILDPPPPLTSDEESEESEEGSVMDTESATGTEGEAPIVTSETGDDDPPVCIQELEESHDT